MKGQKSSKGAMRIPKPKGMTRTGIIASPGTKAPVKR
jgi:hypothetical protein